MSAAAFVGTLFIAGVVIFAVVVVAEWAWTLWERFR